MTGKTHNIKVLPDLDNKKMIMWKFYGFFFCGCRTSGFCRVFGYGIWWKNRAVHRLYFSERNWIDPFHFAIGTWHFKFLGRGKS